MLNMTFNFAFNKRGRNISVWDGSDLAPIETVFPAVAVDAVL
jgi:hypothetical protein